MDINYLTVIVFFSFLTGFFKSAIDDQHEEPDDALIEPPKYKFGEKTSKGPIELSQFKFIEIPMIPGPYPSLLNPPKQKNKVDVDEVFIQELLKL